MKRTLCLAVGSLILTVGLSAPHAVRAQSAPPPPPPPASGGPAISTAVQQLLNQMQSAMRAKGSYHVVQQGTSEDSAGNKQTYSARDDVSSKLQRARFLLQSQLTPAPSATLKATSSQTEIISVGVKQVVRQNKGGWRCATKSGATKPTYDEMNLPAHPIAGVLLGDSKVGNTAVTGVSLTSEEPAANGLRVRQVIMLFIGKTNHLLYKEDASRFVYSQSNGKIIQQTATHETLNFSKFGEKVQVKLPKAC